MSDRISHRVPKRVINVANSTSDFFVEKMFVDNSKLEGHKRTATCLLKLNGSMPKSITVQQLSHLLNVSLDEAMDVWFELHSENKVK